MLPLKDLPEMSGGVLAHGGARCHAVDGVDPPRRREGQDFARWPPQVFSGTAAPLPAGRLPRKPWCAHLNKRAVVRPQATAQQMEYLQINLPTAVNAIVVDVDRAVDPMFWDEAGAPVPNFVVQHPDTRTAHVFYLLTVPVHISSHGTKPKAQRWLEALEADLNAILGGDPACRRPLLVKNPTHPAWRTHAFRAEPHDLADLDYWIKKHDLDHPGHLRVRDQVRAERLAEAEAMGRNCSLFEAARLHAYDAVAPFRAAGGHEAWRAHMLSWVERQHAQEYAHRPLPFHEIRSIAKSVARWTWLRYRGNGKNRGAMAPLLHPDMTIQQRQVAGALYSATKRREATAEKIRAGISSLAPQIPTQAAFAAAAGVSLSTVKRRWQAIQTALSNGQWPADAEVSRGVYQGQPGERREPGSAGDDMAPVVAEDDSREALLLDKGIVDAGAAVGGLLASRPQGSAVFRLDGGMRRHRRLGPPGTPIPPNSS